MPPGWQEESPRVASYALLQQPGTVPSCIDPRRARLTTALPPCNRDRPQPPHGHLSSPAANEDRRRLAVER